MAVTRIMSLHTGKGRTAGKAISDILDYVENPQKTDNGRLISSYQCDSRIADAQFLFSKRLYEDKTGRRRGRDDVIAYTIRQSFAPGEITPEEANRLGRELAMRFTKGNHAFIVCTHIDKAHIHNHIVWDATSLDHSRKFRDFLGSGMAVRHLSDTICVENGYSIIANPKRRGKSYNKWLGGKPPCQRDHLRAAIDAALAQKPDSLDSFIKLLEQNGVEAEWRGNSLRLKTKDGKRFIRLDADSMGEDYALDALLEVFSGKRTHTPRTVGQPIKVNLLVDIQAKLRAGKGVGYERWAKVFNLKQMAQTLNYLTAHDLLDYENLSAKAAAASEKYNGLSVKIKDVEKRMAEIAVLKTHIINYAKTRDVYAAYRKAAYSKKFKAEHESDILLHQAAKKAFDGLGLKKLPSVKSLQAEYASLLAEKKTAYAAYREARGEMKELLTVKANVDRILGKDGQKPERDSTQQTAVGEH